MRRTGVPASMRLTASSFFRTAAANLVSTKPGAMAFTRMLLPPSSYASVLVIEMTAALVMRRRPGGAAATRPATLATLMIEPAASRARRCLTTSRVIQK